MTSLLKCQNSLNRQLVSKRKHFYNGPRYLWGSIYRKIVILSPLQKLVSKTFNTTNIINPLKKMKTSQPTDVIIKFTKRTLLYNTKILRKILMHLFNSKIKRLDLLELRSTVILFVFLFIKQTINPLFKKEIIINRL